MTRFLILIVLALALSAAACTAENPTTTGDTTATNATEQVSKVASDDFDAKVLQSEQPVIVDFYADWCGPCVKQAPILAKVGAEHAATVKTYKLDVDAAEDIAKRYGIRSIPTLIVFKDGKVATTKVGFHDEEALRKLYASAVE